MWISGALMALAGLQLFVFTERTERYFAWTIDPPLTAAFLGASYWSAVAFEWGAARRRIWAEARITVPTVFVFTVLTLVVTLIHIEDFHLGDEFETTTLAVTWLWIAVYTFVPIAMAVIWFAQVRSPGIDPPRHVLLPAWLRALVAVQAVALAGLGVALLVAPEWAAGGWPWSLTPLTARAIGAWLASLGVVAAHALWEDDAVRLIPAAIAYLVFGVLQTVALIRYPETMEWTTLPGVAYVLFLAITFLIGGATLHLARRTNSPVSAVP